MTNEIMQIRPIYVVIAFMWVVQVALSRMYLGLHSPLDLFGGIVIGGVLCLFWLKYGDAVDHFLMTCSYVEIFVLILFVILAIIHPRSVSTPSYSRAIVMVGLALGIVIGSHVQYAQNPINDWVGEALWHIIQQPLLYLRNSHLWSSASPQLWRIFIRLIIGFFTMNVVFLLCVRIAFTLFYLLFARSGISSIFSWIYYISQVFTCPSFEPAQSPPIKKLHGKRANLPADPITWSKFTASIVIAILVTQTMPSLFVILDKELFHLH